jgi:cytoskeletal protein RodZ
MRFSVAFLAVAAIGARAAPQDYSVQPISQISDGQIQAPPASAPPASSATPPVVSVTESAPLYTATEIASITVVVPSVTGAPVVPSPSAPVVVAPSAPAVNSSVVAAPSTPANGTVSTGAPTAPSSSAAEASETGTPSGSSPGAPEATGGAVVNMISISGLALAVAGIVFA